MNRFFAFTLSLFAAVSLQAAQQTINVGATANDGTGDTVRAAFGKANANFTELYARPNPSSWTGSSNLVTVGTLTSGAAGSGFTVNLGSVTITGSLPIVNGGTGATTASEAINALMPAQSGQEGKFLTTNGTVVAWGTLPAVSANALTGNTLASGITASSLTSAAGGTFGTNAFNSTAFLTANQAITLSGDVTGGGATAIAVTIGDGKVTNAMLSGGIDLAAKVTGLLPDGNIASAATWNAKQAAITMGSTAQYLRGDLSLATLNAAAVALGNVDNTSDAIKNATAATLTNKTISGAANTLTVRLANDVTGLLPDANVASAATWNAKQAAITTGSTAQYLRGDLSLATLNAAAVALGNVDNTSDVTKNSAAATLTNKTISGAANTLTVRLANDVTGLLPDANVASAATWNAKQSALTFSTGLTNTGGAVTVNTTQNIAKLSSLGNGLVKATSGDGTLGTAVAGTDYLTPTGTGAALTGITVQSSIQNDSAGFAKFRAAVSKLQAGTSSVVRVLCIGDSNTAGVGAAGAVGAANKPLSYPSQLATILTARGVGAREASFLGTNVDHVNTTSPVGYDPRLIFGAGWSVNGSLSLGGFFFSNTTTTNAMAFSPTQTFDTIEIYYGTVTGTSTFTVDIDGAAALATVNAQNASAGIVKATYTVALGVHTVNIKRATGSVFFLGVLTRNSAAKELSIINAGVGAITSTEVAAAGTYGPMTALPVLAPDLTIISLELNDANTLVSTATYQANLQTIITAAKATGSVLMVTAIPGGTTNTLAGQSSYNDIFKAAALSNGVPLVDIYGRWVSYSASNALGLNFDTLHPNAAGYADKTRAIAAPIAAECAGIAQSIFGGTLGTTISRLRHGVVTLTSGTATVSDAQVTANTRILLSGQDNNVTGALRVSARTAGTSFTVISSNSGDSGVAAYEMIEP